LTNTENTPIEPSVQRSAPGVALSTRRGSGGDDSPTGENWLLSQGVQARAERRPDRCTIRLQAGDVLRTLTFGGGWGISPAR